MTFEETVKELEEEWNESEGMVTCEFPTSGEDAINKMLILDASSNRLEGGVWAFTECETCRSYNPETPYHVDIRRNMSHDEAHTIRREQYHILRLCEKLQAHSNVAIPVMTLLDVLNKLEELTGALRVRADEPRVLASDLGLRPEDLAIYRELTLLYDEHLEDNKLMGEGE